MHEGIVGDEFPVYFSGMRYRVRLFVQGPTGVLDSYIKMSRPKMICWDTR